MKDELPLNKELMKNHIFNNYDIKVLKMKHVPIGEVANSYILFTENQTKYFLKIYLPSRIVNKTTKTLEESHKIAYLLNHQEQITQVISPIQTKTGELKSVFEGVMLVVWSFAEGKMATEKQRTTKEFLQNLAILLGSIHNSTNKVKSTRTAKFSFDLKFRKDLLLCIKEVTASTTSKDPNYNKLQVLIKQYMDIILESLVFIENLSMKLKERADIEFVLCHSDPIIHNIIIKEDNQLYLVDWDGAILAPFEQDIWFYLCDDQYRIFFQKYKEIKQFSSIDEDIVIYLFYERTLADLTDWVHRILFEEVSQEQIKSDFNGLEEDSWPVLANIKETEGKLRKRVKELSR